MIKSSDIHYGELIVTVTSDTGQSIWHWTKETE